MRPFAAALLAVLALTSCREASGVASDPMDREAEDALVAYLKIDTSNPPGNETSGAVFLRDLLARDGIAAQLVGDDPKRQGVYARMSSGTNEKALLLITHIDVVPADASSWRNPPFGGVREGGYIWGRGTLDIKSLTIAHAMSLIDLKRRHAKLTRDVIFLAVPDEELGGVNGTKALLEKHPELFANAGFVMNEGGANETALDRVVFWGIEVQQKVPLWLRVTCEGDGGHGASPPDDGGATAKLVRALSHVQAIETPYRLDPSVARVNAAAAAVRTDAKAAKLRDPLRHVNDLPRGMRALLQDPIAVTQISADGSVNVIPTKAAAGIDIRLLPSTAPEEMLKRVQDAVGKDGRVEVVLSSQPLPESPPSGPLWDVVTRAMRAASAGSAAGPMVTAGTTDSRYFRARGIPSYGVMPFKVNYYDAEGVHGNDERIRARFFAEGVRLMRTIVRNFCSE
ncbi:MAG TPA: M20/M25/M40 family metallo-hydrolase [Thermoanaerobaculia bacterium]|nr:M20/M25/M40 family metallo-hydrolase [Thermoanaerobaculia bacterium]